MNTAPVAPLRYILTPTVKDEYDSDQAGYDAASDEPTMVKLSDENDKVSGLEHLYGHIINHRERPSTALGDVTGNEGFMDIVKSAANGVIETIRRFFKWLWSFFGSKAAAAEVKTRSLKNVARAKGVKDGEIKYPKNTLYIYSKTGRPEGNLNWLAPALQDLEHNTDKVEKYAKLIEDYCNKVKTELSGKGSYAPILSAFEQGVKDLFKPNGENLFTFGIPNNMRVSKEGKMTWEGVSVDRKRFQGATFQVNITQFNELVDKVNAVQAKLEQLTKDLTKLEDPMVRSLEAALHEAAGKGDNPEEQRLIKAGIDEIKRMARTAMQNIGNLETELYRAYLAVVDILQASVKE